LTRVWLSKDLEIDLTLNEIVFFEQSFDDALERIHLILEDHDYFNLNQPIWYKSIPIDNVTGL